MTVLLSAAHTEATPRKHSNPLNSHRYAHRVTPLPRVEFIYTPDISKIGLTFKGLCSAGQWQDQPPHRKYVDDLDSSLSEPSRGASLRARPAGAAQEKTSHNGHCVTLEPRPRYNMSHRRPPRAGWHACCLYNRQERRSGPREGSKQARRILIKRGFGMRLRMPVGYHASTGQK